MGHGFSFSPVKEEHCQAALLMVLGCPPQGLSAWIEGSRASLFFRGFTSSSSHVSEGEALKEISKGCAPYLCLSYGCQTDNVRP